MDEKRVRILRAAIPSIETALSLIYCKRGWKKSGLHPYNPQEILLRSEVQQALPQDATPQNPAKKTRREKFHNHIYSSHVPLAFQELEAVEI